MSVRCFGSVLASCWISCIWAVRCLCAVTHVLGPAASVLWFRHARSVHSTKPPWLISSTWAVRCLCAVVSVRHGVRCGVISVGVGFLAFGQFDVVAQLRSLRQWVPCVGAWVCRGLASNRIFGVGFCPIPVARSHPCAVTSVWFRRKCRVRPGSRCGSISVRVGFPCILGSSMSVRSLLAWAPAASVRGALTRVGSIYKASVIDFLHLGSSLSVRSFARCGSAASVVYSSWCAVQSTKLPLSISCIWAVRCLCAVCAHCGLRCIRAVGVGSNVGSSA